MKLLLLEDDRDAREALAALLELDGFRVLQAADAPEFHAAVSNLDIDSIIFDVQIEGKAIGLELVMSYQMRRVNCGRPLARLVCLTGSDDDIPTAPSLYPIARHLRKPAEYSTILVALRARLPV